MNILDIVLLLCLIPAIIQGIRKGFIAQAVAIISLVLGGWLAYVFSDATAQWLTQWIDTQVPVLHIISFILIFAIVATILMLVGKVLESSIKIILLGWLNRLLGLVFSLFKFTIIIGLVIISFEAINDKFEFVSKAYLDSSLMYSGFKSITYAVFPYLKQLLS